MYNNNQYNPYYQNYTQPQQPVQYQQPQQPVQQQGTKMNGRQVESIEVAKVADIPLDGSLNMFVVLDGSAIVTKQLQNDGTCKLMVYKPSKEQETSTKFVTIDDVHKEIEKLDIDDLIDSIESLKKEVKSIKKKGD